MNIDLTVSLKFKRRVKYKTKINTLKCFDFYLNCFCICLQVFIYNLSQNQLANNLKPILNEEKQEERVYKTARRTFDKKNQVTLSKDEIKQEVWNY